MGACGSRSSSASLSSSSSARKGRGGFSGTGVKASATRRKKEDDYLKKHDQVPVETFQIPTKNRSGNGGGNNSNNAYKKAEESFGVLSSLSSPQQTLRMPPTISSITSGTGSGSARNASSSRTISQSDLSSVPPSSTFALPPPSPSLSNFSFIGGNHLPTSTTRPAPANGMSLSDPFTVPSSTVKIPPGSRRGPANSSSIMVGGGNHQAASSISKRRSSIGSGTLEVPVQNPKRTQIVTEKDFFNVTDDDEMELEDFDEGDDNNNGTGTNRTQVNAGTASSFAVPFFESSFPESFGDEEILEQQISNSNNMPFGYHNNHGSFHSASSSSYEEIVIDSDDDEEFEVESCVVMPHDENARTGAALFTHADSDEYEEEVIDDATYEAFLRAQQASAGKLTFDDFLSHVQQKQRQGDQGQDTTQDYRTGDTGFDDIQHSSPVNAAATSLNLDLEAFQSSKTSTKSTSTAKTTTNSQSSSTTVSPGGAAMMMQRPKALAVTPLDRDLPNTKSLSMGSSVTDAELQMRKNSSVAPNYEEYVSNDGFYVSQLPVASDQKQGDGFPPQVNHLDTPLPSSLVPSPLAPTESSSNGRPKSRTSSSNKSKSNNSGNVDRTSSKSKKKQSNKKSSRTKGDIKRHEREHSTSRGEGKQIPEITTRTTGDDSGAPPKNHGRTTCHGDGRTEEKEKEHRTHHRRKKTTEEGCSASPGNADENPNPKKDKKRDSRHEKQEGGDFNKRKSKKEKYQETCDTESGKRDPIASPSRQSDEVKPSSRTTPSPRSTPSRKIKYVPAARKLAVEHLTVQQSPTQKSTQSQASSKKAIKFPQSPRSKREAIISNPVSSPHSKRVTIVSRSVKNRQSSGRTAKSGRVSRFHAENLPKTIDDNTIASSAKEEKESRDETHRRKSGKSSDGVDTSRSIENSEKSLDDHRTTKAVGEKKKSRQRSSPKDREERTTKAVGEKKKSRQRSSTKDREGEKERNKHEE